MKQKSFFLWLLMIICTISCKYDDGELWDKVNSLDERLANIENQLTQMNTDITSMGKPSQCFRGLCIRNRSDRK